MTIKEFAAILGVSTATVSRALSDKWDVNPQTKERIIKAAQEYNFRPNPMAQRLKKRRSQTIGIVVPEFMNSFFSKVIMGVQDCLYKEGYNLLITQSNESVEIEEANIKLLENSVVEGIIISTTRDGYNTELYKKLIRQGLPLVFFNRVCPDAEAPKIVINDQHMAYEVTKHLIEQGCRRIAYLSGPENLSLTAVRMTGYQEALREAGIEIDPNLIVQGGIYQQKGYDAVQSLYNSKTDFDAVFAFNDPSAIGALQFLKEKGIRVPEQVALAGFSESRSALLVEPKLTSVEQPTYEMGEMAARIMVEMIKIKESNSKRRIASYTYMDAKLNIRESSLKKKDIL